MKIKCLLFFSLCLISNSLVGQNLSAEKIYKKYNDAVVRIFTYYGDNTQHGQASGVIIKKEGWIVTNYHVLGDAAILYAEHKGKFVKLDSIVAIDDKKDIMVLKFSEQKTDYDIDYKSIPNIKIGNSDHLKVGQKIYAIGSPYGFENTITEGIISGLRASFDSTQNYMQISAPISSGSSGGAVINSKGELIGISAMVYSGQTAQNLNFAILINDVIEAAKTKKKIPDSQIEQSLDYYYQKGGAQFATKNYISAIFNYKNALQYANTNESGILYYYLGLSYYKLKALDTAIAYYDKSLQHFIFADTYSALGTAYYDKSDFNSAILYYQKAIEKDSNHYVAYIGLGLIYYNQHDYSSSMENLQIAWKLKPGKPESHFLFGRIAYDLAQYDQAISFYQRAIDVDPTYAEAYWGLGNAYLKKGDTEKAIEAQQKAYQLKPELRNSKN